MKKEIDELYKDLKDSYLERLRLEGKSPRSASNRKTAVTRLVSYLIEADLPPHLVAPQQALDYQSSLMTYRTAPGNPYSSRTIAALTGGAVSFFDYLKEENLILSNSFREIRKVRGIPSLPPELPKEKETDRFLEQLSRFNEAGTAGERINLYRTHLIAELLYSTGMRITEAASLKPEDIDLDRSLVKIRQGKGGYPRTAYLNDFAREVLRIYIHEMRDLVLKENNDRTLLFGTGWRTLGGFVNKRLQREAVRQGFSSFTCHRFRHCVGYHLLRSGCPVRFIQEILGHRCIKSTEVYTKIDKENLKAVLDTYHPRKLTKKGNA